MPQPDILFQLKHGNKKAFEAIYLLHQKKILFYISQYIKDTAVSYDICQDTFLSLWEFRNHIDPAKDLLPYLITIAKHKSLNYLRNKMNNYSQKESFSNRETAVALQALEAASDEILIAKEIREVIRQILETLPEKQREVFRLNRYGNMTYEQIANQCNINVKTVEYRMSQVLKILRIHLKDFICLF